MPSIEVRADGSTEVMVYEGAVQGNQAFPIRTRRCWWKPDAACWCKLDRIYILIRRPPRELAGGHSGNGHSHGRNIDRIQSRQHWISLAATGSNQREPAGNKQSARETLPSSLGATSAYAATSRSLSGIGPDALSLPFQRLPRSPSGWSGKPSVCDSVRFGRGSAGRLPTVGGGPDLDDNHAGSVPGESAGRLQRLAATFDLRPRGPPRTSSWAGASQAVISALTRPSASPG